jgi:hypothetical protein
MEPAIDTAPSSAPPPSAPAPDVGNVVAPPSGPPIVDAPPSPKIEPRDSEVPVDLDHPLDAQPDLRESFPDQPQPEQREAPQPQEPQPQPELPAPIALPDVFDQAEADAWTQLPRQTQEILAQTIEFTKQKLAPQIEQATQMSAAHHEALWASISIHSQKAAALVQLAKTNPQQLEAFAQSPDGQRYIAEVGAERAAIQNHGRQIISQMQEARRVESEQRQQQFERYGEEQDARFREGHDISEEDQDEAVDYLRDVGVPEDVVEELWTGRSKLSGSQVVRSAEFQQVLHDALQWRRAQARQAAAKERAQQQARERSRAISPPLRPGVGGGSVAPPSTLAAAASSGNMPLYYELRNKGALR